VTVPTRAALVAVSAVLVLSAACAEAGPAPTPVSGGPPPSVTPSDKQMPSRPGHFENRDLSFDYPSRVDAAPRSETRSPALRSELAAGLLKRFDAAPKINVNEYVGNRREYGADASAAAGLKLGAAGGYKAGASELTNAQYLSPSGGWVRWSKCLDR